MIEIFIIFILLGINGLLAMSEIAFVSAKKYKLENLAQKGIKSAKKSLVLLEEPERFLSAIQIGITLVGILAGAYGGYAIAEDITPYVQKVKLLEKYAMQISFAAVVSVITYFSLVIGELVPKTIALKNPEKITILFAPLMILLVKAFKPFVFILSVSTKVVIFFFRIKKNEEPPVTEDELKSLIELGKKHGTFEKEESEIINKIFSFNDKKVSSIMIPRKELEWIDYSFSNKEIFNFISTHNYSRYFVCEGEIDKVLGFIESKEFLVKYHSDPLFQLKSIINQSLVVPESLYTFDLLEKFRQNKTNIALVVDEYGGTQGLVTLHDLIENIIGEIPDKFDKAENKIIRRNDGSLLIDGMTELQVVSDYLSEDFNSDEYTTIGGYLMAALGKVPVEGECIAKGDYILEVIDMDGKRVDKILVRKTKKNDETEEAESGKG